VLGRAALVTAVLACALVAAVAHAAVPSDPLTQNAVFEAVDLPRAWDITTGSPDVVIAVVDSGVDASHPDLAGAVDQGYDFVDGDTDASDGDGHGTGVAGIAAARANNGIGAAGVCWSCRILPLRVLGPDGFALQTAMADAIDYAVDRGAAVVNVSLYGGNHNVLLEDAIVRARRAGVVVAAAAGNEGSTIREYPAAFPAALSVGAVAAGGRLAGYSNRGDWVKFAAPSCVVTTQVGGGFGAGCGTSGATPLVAGIVALLRARAPFATVAQIESALARTARPVAGVRFGLIDAYAALQALGQPAPRFEPTIVGTAAVGETLTAYTGIWAGARVEPAYAWERCRGARCEQLATGTAYRVRSADRGAALRVTLSAADVPSAVSARSAVVQERARNERRPSIVGRALVGKTLRAGRGSWSGTTLSFSATWIHCRAATCRGGDQVGRGWRYRVRTADRGLRLRVVVTATNRLGSVTSASTPTMRIR
jgi:hypothetical protein